jgi:hypothetical protein
VTGIDSDGYSLNAMTRVQWMALGAYAVLMYLAFGPPLNEGTVDVTVLAFAHLLLGLGVARWWTLALPLVVAVAALFLITEEWGLLAVFAGPVCVALTAVGRLLAYPARVRVVAAVACGGVCVLALVGDALVELRKGPPLPAAVQRRLPSQNSLLALCPWADDARADQARARASVDVLLRELRQRPNHTVTYTFYWAHSDEEVRDITVRQLADTTLDDLEHGDARGPCAPEVQARLRAAL